MSALVRVSDASAAYGVPLRTVYRWVADGRCVRRRRGGVLVVDLAEIEWLAEHRPGRRICP